MRSLLRALPLAALLSCTLGREPMAPEGSLKVLFIGNSLTYENDLPRTVAQLALSAGQQTCYCYQIAYPNFALEDHWDFGDAVRALQKEPWDFVVMQQGPSATAKQHLITWSTIFAELADSAGAMPVMYGVWPEAERAYDFERVADSYRAAAETIGGLFANAGGAWLQAWDRDSTLALYASDQFHPSTMGTYLAALTIFQRIYNVSPVGVQQSAVVDGRAMSWPIATVRLLQEAAAASNAAEDARSFVRR